MLYQSPFARASPAILYAYQKIVFVLQRLRVELGRRFTALRPIPNIIQIVEVSLVDIDPPNKSQPAILQCRSTSALILRHNAVEWRTQRPLESHGASEA